ncbi:MAG: DUF3891 family protein [Chamaesiphon sp.]|nr:DUF3891 family protein [Chamaesiphon sp.]
MITNLIDNGWEIIYHRAHALLAAQIAGYWQTPDDTAHLVETIAAIAHHDDLEREWQGNHLTKACAPFDFTLGGSTSIKSLYEHVDDARYRGRWVALLVSMHMTFLSQGKYGENPELDEFVDRQIELQTAWRKSLKVKKVDAEKAYAMMQCCDRLSLILCQRQLPEGERLLEIAKGPTGQRHDILKRADQTLSVNPWPFVDENFTVHVDACYPTQMKFDSNQELVESLQQASISSLQWNFVK